MSTVVAVSGLAMAGNESQQRISHEKTIADSIPEKSAAEAEASRFNTSPPLFIIPSIGNADPNLDANPLHQSSTSRTDNETYPEGGLRAWLVVFGCWLALFASLGLMNTLATFQSYLISHQLANYEEGIVGWVFSIYTFVVFFLGLYIGPMFDKWGPRWIVLAGTVSICGGLMLFSISTGTFSYS